MYEAAVIGFFATRCLAVLFADVVISAKVIDCAEAAAFKVEVLFGGFGGILAVYFGSRVVLLFALF